MPTDLPSENFRDPPPRNPFWLLFGYAMQITSRLVVKLRAPPGLLPEEVDIVELPLALPRVAPGFDGYRIVQISDIHMGTWMTSDRLAVIVDLVNAQNPDLIAITGDFVAYTVKHTMEDLTPLKRLSAPDGIVAVLGNHDHATDPEAIRESLFSCTQEAAA